MHGLRLGLLMVRLLTAVRLEQDAIHQIGHHIVRQGTDFLYHLVNGYAHGVYVEGFGFVGKSVFAFPLG